MRHLNGNMKLLWRQDLISRCFSSSFGTRGSWTFIEAGDGGVSGLSEGQDQGAFFRAVKAILQ